VEAKPSLDLRPHSHCDPTLEEEVSRGLLTLLAKRAKVAIRPSPTLQSIGGPHSIMNNQPSEKFALCGGPSFPNGSDHGRGGVDPQTEHCMQKMRSIPHL